MEVMSLASYSALKKKKKNFSGKVGKMPVVPTERHIRTK